jgi:hypothetical protein
MPIARFSHKNKQYIAKKQTLIIFPKGCLNKINSANISVDKIITGMPVTKISVVTGSSLTNRVIPNPATMLNMLEPIILPSAISTLL